MTAEQIDKIAAEKGCRRVHVGNDTWSDIVVNLVRGKSGALGFPPLTTPGGVHVILDCLVGNNPQFYAEFDPKKE